VNREDIIRMAWEAGFTEDLAENWLPEVLVWEAEPKNLERFAALVAAHEREVWAKYLDDCGEHEHANYIRSRGEAKP
jgi:hypothetical protein